MLSDVKVAVNHDVLQQFLICADTKYNKVRQKDGDVVMRISITDYESE